MKKVLLLVFVLWNTVVYGASDDFGVSVNAGRGSSIDIFRLGLQKSFDSIIYSNESISLKGFHEVGLNHWSGNRNNLWALSYSPVFVIDFNKYAYTTYRPYIDLGVGVAFLSETQIDNKDMSSSFQFEDRISIGLRKENIDFYIRYMHYSNGGVRKPNHGLNMGLVGINYRF
ncbi:MAG: acyloxyacyl hydrolase [Arcobacteraceae bacterium]|nr:acyloxyacyl hydrolase [Arcobacteraceae bacterium]MDY0326904.1 acyloxyacyl hydrolase [Arcobacteraceae bacterium]